MDAFVKKMFQVFQIKQQTELRYEPEQKVAGNDELRFQMMKLSLLHDTLSKDCQKFLAKYIPA